MVLGAIIEAVSGQDYFDYVRQHSYEPAGMINSDAYTMDRATRTICAFSTAMLCARC